LSDTSQNRVTERLEWDKNSSQSICVSPALPFPRTKTSRLIGTGGTGNENWYSFTACDKVTTSVRHVWFHVDQTFDLARKLMETKTFF